MLKRQIRSTSSAASINSAPWKHIRTGLILAAFVAFNLATATEPAVAGDAEDTRDIVGKWSGFLVETVEFKADGTYRFSSTGLGGKWRISNGKLLTETLFGLNHSDYTLGRDTFIWLGETRRRVK